MASEEDSRREEARLKAAEKAIASLMAKDDDDDDNQDNTGTISCLGFFRDKKKKNGTKPQTPPVVQPPPQPPKKFFGASLTEVYKEEGLLASAANGVRCPIPVYRCVEYLRNVITLEGLFRVSGTWGEINRLKAAFESGESPDFAKVDNPHSVSSLLDTYLRQLPDPLLTTSLYDDFIRCGSIPDIPERVKAVGNVIHQLPDAHFSLLKYLLPFFKDITTHVGKNKMDARNLGLIFGPILMGGDEALSLLQIGKIKTQANLVELMITNCEVLLLKGESNTSQEKGVEMATANGQSDDDDSTNSSSAED